MCTIHLHYLYNEPTDEQLINRSSRCSILHCCYMFRRYCVIFRELVVSTCQVTNVRECSIVYTFCPGELNPLFQTAINPQPPYITWKDQLCFSLQIWHYSRLTAPHLQHKANQGMYNFRFTILINTNNTSNYQSTNETHYTQQNTATITHKRSQLLIQGLFRK